jgi:hypothetical protein
MNRNPYKVGDRVIWKLAADGGGGIACIAPPCDPTPGTVIGVGAGVRDPNPGGHIVDNPDDLVVVRHDSGGDAGWTADMLVRESLPIGFPSVEEWCEALGRKSGSPQCKHPDEGPGLGTVVAVGLAAVGLVGLGMYLMSRKPSKFALAKYTIGLEGSAFDPRAQKFRDELEREGFEVTGFGTESRFDGKTLGGDIDVFDPRGTSFDQEASVAESQRLFKLGQKHGLNVSFVSAGPTGEESCIPCGDDSGWEVIKSNGDVSYPYHNKGDAESDARINGGKVRPLVRFSDSAKLKKVYRS